jgi:hypothetical protein
MSRIDLNTLSQFAVVARHLNFRRAAAELAVAPSTLSERIRDLEDQLGCCQTKANQSHFSSNLNPSGYAKAAPLGKSGGAVQLEI